MWQRIKCILKKILHQTNSLLGPLYWTLAGMSLYRKFFWPKRHLNRDVKPVQKLRIAFVASWFGRDIAGGAEKLCLSLIEGIQKYFPDIQITVLTTTLKEFSEDWNRQHHPAGRRSEDGIEVIRFPIRPVNRLSFHTLNNEYLMKGGTKNLKNPKVSPLNIFQEAFFLKHMIDSPELIKFLYSEFHSFDFFVYLPYMFAPTVIGGLTTAPKSIVIPCLHDERYIFLSIYQRLLTQVRATFYNVKSELELAREVFGHKLSDPHLIGVQVELKGEGNAQRFRQKYGIDAPFILYAGRVIAGKNVPDLVEKFTTYKNTFRDDLKLVVIGKGDIKLEGRKDIVDLGFVSEEDKADAFAAATLTCQPSLNESFSIVMMESWLQNTPVLAHFDCKATRDHCEDSLGGLCYSDQVSFDRSVQKILRDVEWRKEAGQKGHNYVLENYSPQKVVTRFVEALQALSGEKPIAKP